MSLPPVPRTSWTELSLTDGTTYTVENRGGFTVYLALLASAPTPPVVSHELRPEGAASVRLAATDTEGLYAWTRDPDSETTLVVTPQTQYAPQGRAGHHQV